MVTNNENINIRDLIKKVVNKNKQNLTPEEVKMQEEAMINIFEKGMIPGEALGFDEDFLEYVYKYAYTLYQRNKIEEASQLFRWLKVMVPFYPKYNIALMHCFILQKKWIGAVACLMELAYQDLEDPYPFEKMSECLIEAGDFGGALIAMEKAIQRAGDKKEFAQKKERWLMNYEYILSQIDIDPETLAKIRAKRKEKTVKAGG